MSHPTTVATAAERHAWSVREAAANDIDPVRGLLGEAQLPVEGMADRFPTGYAVAIAGERVIGAAGVEVHGRHGLLRSVVVAPDCGGQGLGESLVRDRLRWAGEHRLASVSLLTTTAAGFFRRLGFRVADRASAPASIQSSSEFAALCPASAVLMTLTLTDEMR